VNTHGYTAQYVTIAIALRIQLVEYFQRAGLIAEHGSLHGNEELEARRLTIVLLTAALCESYINAALALSLSPAEFRKIERKPPIEKWLVHSKRVNPAFAIDLASSRELEFLIECRNATTHAQPQVFSEAENIHPGNHESWSQLTHERVLPLAKLVVSLLTQLCAGTQPFIATIPSSVAWELRLVEFESKPENSPKHGAA
jgi:hypothetical protein